MTKKIRPQLPQHGLNIWGTADAYGMGPSENMLGGFLKDLLRPGESSSARQVQAV